MRFYLRFLYKHKKGIYNTWGIIGGIIKGIY
nr:MAG TPA: hypothetical protein [Caudoviricetes sp.]